GAILVVATRYAVARAGARDRHHISRASEVSRHARHLDRLTPDSPLLGHHERVVIVRAVVVETTRRAVTCAGAGDRGQFGVAVCNGWSARHLPALPPASVLLTHHDPLPGVGAGVVTPTRRTVSRAGTRDGVRIGETAHVEGGRTRHFDRVT